MKRFLAVLFSFVMLSGFVTAEAEEQKTGTYTIVTEKQLPAAITERKLKDDEIASLADADLATLKKKISTFGDYMEWVKVSLVNRKTFNELTTSNPNMQVTFGGEFAFSWLASWFSPNQTASVAHYVLEEDYPGMGTIVCALKDGSSFRIKCACYFPADEGYYILNPEVNMKIDRNRFLNSCSFQDYLLVSDLTGVIPYCEEVMNGRVTQVLALNSPETVVLDVGDSVYVSMDMSHIQTVYQDDNAKYPPEDSKLNFKSFGFPKSLKTDSALDAAAARKLAAGTYEEAAEAIKTLPDCMNYLYYSGYSQYGIDQSLEMHDGEWHYNYKPNVVFARGKGNCGGTSGLIAGLLQGDYDEVGMINLRFPNDGHVINYIKDGNLYYVFDGIGWVGCGFQSYGLCFCHGNTLEKAAEQYAKSMNTRQMAAYLNSKGGDCPIIFYGNATIIPNNYCEWMKILQETPEEGFTYTQVEADQRILDAIDTVRGVW